MMQLHGGGVIVMAAGLAIVFFANLSVQAESLITVKKIDFPVYWYGERAVIKFNLKAIPLLVFIKQGEVIERLPGSRPEWFLDEKIREFIK